MQRRIALFLAVAALVLFFVIIFDRWGQKAFVTTTLSLFAPLKNKKDLKAIKGEVDRSTNKSVFSFPKTFLIGTSSSAYQIEGGWNEDGKTPSIWDDFVHFHPHSVDDNTTADVGPDSYHNFQEDIRALKLVGVSNLLIIIRDDAFNLIVSFFFLNTKFQHYRFSISWARILPTGSAVNQNGIDYYTKLIDELIANNIEPVTLSFRFTLA